MRCTVFVLLAPFFFCHPAPLVRSLGSERNKYSTPWGTSSSKATLLSQANAPKYTLATAGMA